MTAICSECGMDTDLREHRFGCSHRVIGDYRAARTVQDPRFVDGVYVGWQPIDPAVAAAREQLYPGKEMLPITD